MVGTSSYTYDQCELCQAIKNITETAKHEHTYTEWQLRNKFAANDDGSVAVPEYWVRYCSNNYPLDESIKCAHHQDYICDFALYELELTPPADYDGVSAPVKPGEEAEDPEDPETVPAKDKYDLTSVSLNPDLAVITYAPVEGKTITNLRVEAYMLGQGTTYFAINLRVMSDGGDLQFPMNGAFGFAFRLYDADTGETVDEVSKFFID